MYALHSHSYYTHLIPDLGIVREPTLWGLISSPSRCAAPMTLALGPTAADYTHTVTLNRHTYTHLLPDLGIVRLPILWVYYFPSRCLIMATTE